MEEIKIKKIFLYIFVILYFSISIFGLVENKINANGLGDSVKYSCLTLDVEVPCSFFKYLINSFIIYPLLFFVFSPWALLTSLSSLELFKETLSRVGFFAIPIAMYYVSLIFYFAYVKFKKPTKKKRK